ncbi:MAG: glycosyl transferase group 1, partial [Acidobacteria bacterium]
MRSLVLIVPGSIETRTGGYEYDRRMAAALRARGWTVGICELDDGFPLPTPAQLERAQRALAAIPDGATVLVDGLALGVMPEQAEREASRLRIVALVHLPLAAEPGIRREFAVLFEATERRALAAARLVVVTGQTTVAALERYGVDRDRVVVVEPGTMPAPLARGSVDGP